MGDVMDARRHIAQLVTVLAVAASTTTIGCVASTDDEQEATSQDDAPLARGELAGAFGRVVLGRIFQHADWLVPAADTYRADQYKTPRERHVAYVCDTYAALDPTYVSGLIRLDADEDLSDDQVLTYNAIRRCIRSKANHPVRFDVVLNAEHYADPAAYPTAGKGADALRARLQNLEKRLAPDLYFFDFYTVPFHDKDDTEWNEGAIVAGIAWIHAHKRLVGGNVWGNTVPKGTDFAAIDDSAGLDRTREQAKALRGVPLLMHIQNDPQSPKSAGLAFLHATPQERESLVTKEAGLERQVGFAYMFPVFFPLQFVENDDKDKATKKKMVAYDARQDGSMYAHIKSELR